MKKWYRFLLPVLAILVLVTPALAAYGAVNATLHYSDVKISINGEDFLPTDVNGKSTEPFAMDETTYLPIRAIAQALNCRVSWDAKTNTIYIVSDPTENLLYTFPNDGVAKITDAEQNQHFAGGSALTGIEALLDAGAVYINNMQVPASEGVTDSFVINGFSSLWKTGEGTWAYSVHKLYSGEDLSFEEARLGFIEGISQMRGLTWELYSDNGSGYATRMETIIKESTLVNTLTVNGENTYITRYDFALATDEIRPDVNNVVFPTKNVDPDLKVGDIALYWYDGSEWHIQKAVGETGKLTQGPTKDTEYVLDGEEHTDALITRYNLQAANRTSQFLKAHVALGLSDIDVTMWSTETGFPIGFTRGDTADESLALAIENARKIKETVKVSVDGSDVSVNESWVTAEAMASFDAGIAAAQAVLDDASATSIDMDMAIYNLNSALGSSTGRNPSGLMAAMQAGTKFEQYTFYNDGSTLITDASLDRLFKEGTALEGVEALLDAGKVYVNGFQVPVDESTEEFKVNGFVSLWKTETGWTNSVHKSQDADNLTFEENRMRFIQGLSKMAGLTWELYCDDGSGYVTRMESTIKETVLVDKIMVNGDTTTIDRSNFELAHKPGMPDINNTVFKTEHVDSAINEGDMALYWEAADGWHLEAAVSQTGLLTDGQDHGWYEFNGETYPDSGLTKYSLAKANRPGQYLVAHQNLGLTDIEITMWLTHTGYPFGYTSGDNADEVLSLAIENAEKAKDSVIVAADGSDIQPSEVWVTADELAAYNAAIAEAEDALADKSASNADLDRATYNLDRALVSFQGAQEAGAKYLYQFANDGVAKVTDAEQDQYFAEGSAKAGIEALLAAGKVYVNNVAVPAAANETDSYVINGFSSLWKAGEDTWAYSVHKLYSGEDLSFEEACLGFIEGISQMRGLTVELYDDTGAGYATRMEILIKESTLVNTLTVDGDNTYITRYDFALATDEIRPDVNNVVFPTKNVDPDLKVGDIALYWFDGSEWHIEQAVGETGKLTKGPTRETEYVLDGEEHTDALITRYNLQKYNRTSQFLKAHVALGLSDIDVTMWSTETGFPIGFSRGDTADDCLELAIANAKASVAGNADYDAAIAEAQAALDNAASTSIDLDAAIYNLYEAIKDVL